MTATMPEIIVTPPIHAANELNQQQLLPISNATILPMNDFLWFSFIVLLRLK